MPEQSRERLISRFSLDTTQEGYALGYEFDIVLRGPDETPTERLNHDHTETDPVANGWTVLRLRPVPRSNTTST